MKTITLTDKQFDSIFDFIDSKLEFVIENEIDNPDILEDIKVQHEKKLQQQRVGVLSL